VNRPQGKTVTMTLKDPPVPSGKIGVWEPFCDSVFEVSSDLNYLYGKLNDMNDACAIERMNVELYYYVSSKLEFHLRVTIVAALNNYIVNAIIYLYSLI
jgi:hypothetical protein